MQAHEVKTIAEARAIVETRQLDYVKVGVFDVDGVMRGKYMARDKFFSALENGFGFFGGGYTVSTRWIPPLDVLQDVGFTFRQPCLLDTANIPECQLPPEPCFREE